MKNTTKGGLAAAAAATLLLGGAGSLAYWTTDTDVDAGNITAGTINLSAGTCPANWKYAVGAANANNNVVRFVPGDKITKSCTFTISAIGDNLSATLAAPDTLTYSSAPAAPSLTLVNSASYAITGGANNRTIGNGGVVDTRDNNATVTATFNVTIPYGTAPIPAGTGTNVNDTKGITATLDKINVKLTQVNPNP